MCFGRTMHRVKVSEVSHVPHPLYSSDFAYNDFNLFADFKNVFHGESLAQIKR